ncbi:MAG: hypothetical protein ACOYCD_04215 [Kiritimatiellia bacterium]
MNADFTRDTGGLEWPAALTGICWSGGSADTLIREFIRVSGCPPIHVRIADSAACVRGESSSDTLAAWRFNLSFPFVHLVHLCG